MEDLIDRQAALAEIDATIAGSLQRPEDVYIDKGLMMARKIIEKMTTAASTVNRWISVDDALPENNEIVWVCLYWEEAVYVRKGYIKDEFWYTADGYRMSLIPKFWMKQYIPAPPKDDKT